MIQVVELDSMKRRCEIDLLAYLWCQTYFSEHDKIFLCNTSWKYYSSNSASIHFCKWSSPNYHKLKNILTYRFTWYWNAFSYSILFFEWKRLHGRIGILHKKHHIWQVNINIFYLHVNKLHIMDHINYLLTTYFLCKNSNKKAIKTYDSKY